MIPLRELAGSNDWYLKEIDTLSFVLGLWAKDDQQYFLKCTCRHYPEEPPTWQWSDMDGCRIGTPEVTPTGSGFFHGSGVLCAPWNRLAYKDLNGPHGDWVLAEWKANEKTNGCDTLAHMALRISVEFKGPRYKARMRTAA